MLGVPLTPHKDPWRTAFAQDELDFAVPWHSSRGFPFADTHLPLRQVFEAFGPNRMFWGSDLTRLPRSYQENVTLFTNELPFLSGADLHTVMGWT